MLRNLRKTGEYLIAHDQERFGLYTLRYETHYIEPITERNIRICMPDGSRQEFDTLTGAYLFLEMLGLK